MVDFSCLKSPKFLNEQSKRKYFFQSFSLLLSTVLSIILGVVINYLLTRILGKEQYGNYSLFINILNLSQVLFNFGFFQSICRLVAITENKEKIRGYYFIGLSIVFLLYLVMAVCLIIYSFLSESIAENNLQNAMYIVIVFSWIYLLTNFNELFLQGANEISLLSKVRLYPKILFSFSLFLLFVINSNNISYSLFAHFFSFLLVYLFIINEIKLSKCNFKSLFNEVILSNRNFGFNIYLGSIVATGSAYLSGLLISYYDVNNVSVGYFNLATQLCVPLSLFPNILATVFFRQFAKEDVINKKLIYIMLCVNIILLFFIILLSNPFIILIFGSDYSPASEIVNYIAFGYILYGIGDFYNRFFLSKGRGKELRNASMLVGGILLFSNVILVKHFGAIGAAAARIISGLVYSVIIVFLYYKNK